MEGVQNVPSKEDVGGKSELEQFEDTLAKESDDAPSEVTQKTMEDNDEESEGMLC